MTCEGHDRDLALHVEGELSGEAAGVLERHVQQCERCQALLRSLEDSQHGLKSLAEEPLDDAALASLRVRVLAAASRDAVRAVPSRPWLWALAAGLALMASTVAVLRRSEPVRLPSAADTVVSVPTPQPKAMAEARRPATPDPAPRAARGRSTIRGVLSVSPDVGLQNAGVALTAEEADQLARAVVIVSRIERVSEPPAAAAAEHRPAQVVQLATADPGVVIYWQIDSNGG